MSRVHQDGPQCNGCDAKLATAHPDLVAWYREAKAANPLLHVSCAWRGPKEQEEAFNRGASRARFGQSKHNRIDENGAPRAEALDLFEIIDGKARWDGKTFAALNAENEAKGVKLRWGGTFKTLGDACHFELA